MKKLIRWLSDFSGVTKDIEKETRHMAGTRIMESASWYSADQRAQAGNALWFYGLYLRNNFTTLPDDFLRMKVDAYPKFILHDEKEVKAFFKYSTLK